MAYSENFRTPLSSTDDLMTLSPEHIGLEGHDQPEKQVDFLTDSEYNSIIDATPRDNMFIDSSSLDYFSTCTDLNKTAIIDRGKDSLFVKFDPLYARNMQTNCADTENDVGYETCSTNSVITDSNGANSESSAISVFPICGNDKPTQAVCPVVCKEPVNIRKAQTVLTPALVRSVSAILTPTRVRSEKLINLFGDTPPISAPSHTQQKYYGETHVDYFQSLHTIMQNNSQKLLQLRHEKNELELMLQTTKEEFDKQTRKLTGEVETLQKRECKLVQQVNDKSLSNKQMAIVMEEYEKTISTLIDEQEKLAAEKEQALNHLASMESSFNDLLTKYEKCKGVIFELRENQKAQIQKIAEYDTGMKNYDNLYNTLKQTTADSLNKANETFNNINKSHNIEVTKLNAIIKKQEITISSLQESLSQKTRDIEELTSICDQLINDVH